MPNKELVTILNSFRLDLFRLVIPYNYYLSKDSRVEYRGYIVGKTSNNKDIKDNTKDNNREVNRDIKAIKDKVETNKEDIKDNIKDKEKVDNKEVSYNV